MAIYRAPRPTQAYTVLRNDVLRDDRLSYRARGILAVILSNTDDWRTSAEELARRGQEGRDAIRTALTELEDAGYLQRERRQDERGRWTTQAVVYDAPQAAARQAQPIPHPVDKAGDNSPTTDFQASVLQSSVSQASREEPSRSTVPSERAEGAPAERNPADTAAAAAYEATAKMGNYMALRAVAAKAIKAGFDPAVVTEAMVALVDAGRPVTGQALHASLTGKAGGRGGRVAVGTFPEHWAQGGQFVNDGGGTHG